MAEARLPLPRGPHREPRAGRAARVRRQQVERGRRLAARSRRRSRHHLEGLRTISGIPRRTCSRLVRGRVRRRAGVAGRRQWASASTISAEAIGSPRRDRRCPTVLPRPRSGGGGCCTEPAASRSGRRSSTGRYVVFESDARTWLRRHRPVRGRDLRPRPRDGRDAPGHGHPRRERVRTSTTGTACRVLRWARRLRAGRRPGAQRHERHPRPLRLRRGRLLVRVGIYCTASTPVAPAARRTWRPSGRRA